MVHFILLNMDHGATYAVFDRESLSNDPKSFKMALVKVTFDVTVLIKSTYQVSKCSQKSHKVLKGILKKAQNVSNLNHGQALKAFSVSLIPN